MAKNSGKGGKRSPRSASITTLAKADPRALPTLLSDVRRLIESARGRTAVAVNSELILLYWQVGKRVREDVLGAQRAEYGKKILHTVCTELTREFGPGYTSRNLANMLRFAEVFPDETIVHTLRGQLSWSHLRLIIYVDDPLARDFYAEMARLERWSVRTLEGRVRTMLFERTAVSRKPEAVIGDELKALREDDRLSPDLVFRDPYFLDFLGLRGEHAEKDIESAIVRELQRFILELGTDFAFIARQKRITVDAEDYYLDLLFYHRRLRRLVAVELKLGKFQARDKGQMELYLRWLDENERQDGEEPPIGLILCAGRSAEHVALLRLEDAGIRVAQYMTELPPRELLERKLHDAIRLARLRLEGERET